MLGPLIDSAAEEVVNPAGNSVASVEAVNVRVDVRLYRALEDFGKLLDRLSVPQRALRFVEPEEEFLAAMVRFCPCWPFC
jgi:hypothetical protein